LKAAAGRAVQSMAFLPFSIRGIRGLPGSAETLEFLEGQPCIFDYSGHSIGLYRIRTRDSDKTAAVAHYDMLALSDDLESSFLQGADGAQV
jgi:hypothetical protein